MALIKDITANNYAFFSEVFGAIAALATYNSNWIDLADYPEYGFIQAIKTGVASAGEILRVEVSPDNGTTVITAPGVNADATLAVNSSSAGIMAIKGQITSRYFRLTYINGSTIQGATSRIDIALLKGI